MSKLNAAIQSIAERFAAEILAAVRGMSLVEILGAANTSSPRTRAPRSTPTARKRGRPPKSTHLKVTVDDVVAILKQHKDGLRAADLRKAVGVKRSTWKYLMPKAIAEKKVRLRGTKSHAVYFAA